MEKWQEQWESCCASPLNCDAGISFASIGSRRSRYTIRRSTGTIKRSTHTKVYQKNFDKRSKNKKKKKEREEKRKERKREKVISTNLPRVN